MKISELLVPLQNAVLGRRKTAQNHSPRTGNTMAVKDGEGAKKAAKNCLT